VAQQAMSWTTKESDLKSHEVKNFLFHTLSRPAQGQTAWAKLPEREASHSPPTNVKIKKKKFFLTFISNQNYSDSIS
jgi:hypothetical protein